MTTHIQIWKPITKADIDYEDHFQFYYDPLRQEFVYTHYEGTPRGGYRLNFSEVIDGTPWDWMESQEDLKAYRWKRRTTISDEQVWFLDWARSAGGSETSGCRFSMALSRKRIAGVEYIAGEKINGEYWPGYLRVDWNPLLEWMTTEAREEDHRENI